jgi:hypothetical protein
MYEPWRLPMLGASIFAPDLLYRRIRFCVEGYKLGNVLPDECLCLLWVREFGIRDHPQTSFTAL